jgi:2-methylcitrate dehydratase PrpD
VNETRTEAAEILARYAAGLKFEDIPEAAREVTRLCILDTIVVMIAGTTQGEPYRQLMEMAVESGGAPESTILGFGNKVSAWMAAFVNSALSRPLHYDDTFDEGVTHASCTVVPAALAVAERIGGVSGKDFITAVTIGNDIICRMGLSICERESGWVPDWYQTTIHGVFGAAAACGKLLGLDAAGMRNALGIALNVSSGTLEGPLMSNAFTANGAVLAASMAARGLDGAPNSLEGPTGLYAVYHGNDYNRGELVDELGTRFVSARISVKPWPGLRYFHPYIDATLQLVNQHDIAPEDIAEIKLSVAGYVENGCKPLEKRRRPQDLNEANISLPYLVACAAARRRVLIQDISGDALQDPLTLAVVDKIVPVYDERFSIENKIGPALVEITLNDGTSYVKQVSVAYGHPTNPVSESDFKTKFFDCAATSVNPPSVENVTAAFELGNNLADAPDIRELIRLLS